MHHNYQFFSFYFFLFMLYYSTYTFATRGDACGNAARDPIQVLKGVCRVTVCTTSPGLQRHPIGFSNHFHFFGFDVQVLFFYFLCYFVLLKKMYAAMLHGTTSL